jgi:hypothetical protein
MGKGGTIKPKGLYTSPNQIDAPDGHLELAHNVVIRRPGVIEPRRGEETYGTNVHMRLLHLYKDKLIGVGEDDDNVYYDSDDAGTWLTSGTAIPDDPDTNNRSRWANIGQNAYVTTEEGVYRIDTPSSTPTIVDFPNPGFDALIAQEIKIGKLVRTGGTLVTATIDNPNGVSEFKAGDIVRMYTAGEANFANANITLDSGSSTGFTYSQAGANTANILEQHFSHLILRDSLGFLADGYQVAYRCVLKRQDENGTFISSQVSGRHIVRNATQTLGWQTTVAKNVFLRVLLPDMSDYSDNNGELYVEVYRSKTTVVGVEPNDELQLCYSKKTAASDTTNGYLEFTDVAPNSLLGAFIYTATNQEGIEGDNTPPPLMKDITFYGNCLFGGDVTYKQSLSMQLIGNPIDYTVMSFYYNDTNTHVVPFYEFEPASWSVFYDLPGGTEATLALANFSAYASSTDDVRFTTQALCEALNTVWNSGAVANWKSLLVYDGTDALSAGKFRIVSDRLFNSGVAASRISPLSGYPPSGYVASANQYSPVIGSNMGTQNYTTSVSRVGTTVTVDMFDDHDLAVGDKVILITNTAAFPSGEKTVTSVSPGAIFTYTEAGTATTELTAKELVGPIKYTSTTEEVKNRTVWSKPGDGEHFPLLNFVDNGERYARVIKHSPTRDSLFIWKEDGLWRCTGSNGSFTFEMFDPTLILFAPDSVISIDNNVIALTNKGVVLVTDTGTELISMPIQDSIIDMMNRFQDSMKKAIFAVADEQERQYELYTYGDFEQATDNATRMAWVYNLNTKAWTTFVFAGQQDATSHAGDSAYHPIFEITHGMWSKFDNKKYLARYNGRVLQERRLNRSTDHQAESGAATIASSASATQITFSGSPTYYIGTIVVDFGGKEGRVTAKAGSVATVVSDEVAAWSTGAATLKHPIVSTVRFIPITNGKPDVLKMHSEVELMYGLCHGPDFDIFIKSDLKGTETTLDADTKTLTQNQWTDAGSDANSIIGTVRTPFNLRIDVPQEHVHGHRLRVGVESIVATAKWDIQGIVVEADTSTEQQGE